MSGFTVPSLLSDGDMADILTTAIESGGYGSVIAHRPKNLAELACPADIERTPWYGWVPLVSHYTVVDKYGDKEQGRISRRTLQRGLNILAKKYPHLLAQLVSGNYDVIAADALVQASAFGEVIYG